MEFENQITSRIIGCAIKVHTGLGPGLLESAYESCLEYEMKNSGLTVRRQVPMPLIYGEVKLEVGYRLDLLVEERIIVEVKAVDCFHDIHMAQVLTYLKLTGNRLGLLLNFNVPRMKDGVKRVIL